VASALELRRVSLSYGARRVLHGTSLTLEAGECVALLGANGSGKTTLLRLAAGLLLPDSGEIFVNGEPLPRDEERLRIHRSHTGIVFQAYNLFPHLSALGNVMLPLT
jgi:polar amino acid transport system ATP-binding protein